MDNAMKQLLFKEPIPFPFTASKLLLYVQAAWRVQATQKELSQTACCCAARPVATAGEAAPSSYGHPALTMHRGDCQHPDVVHIVCYLLGASTPIENLCFAKEIWLPLLAWLLATAAQQCSQTMRFNSCCSSVKELMYTQGTGHDSCSAAV